MIQSLENFVSIAIQGTQIPKYTKHTLFLYFSDFSIFFYLKNKINKTKKHPNKIMLNKAKHKTRLTQNKNKKKKNTKTVCVLCTLVLVYLGWPLKQNFLNFVSFIT